MNKEILMVVDAVSNEKGVDKEIIFEALEAALASATRKKHGEDWDVRVAINRKTGDYETFRRWKVFADDSKELENPSAELRLEDGRDVSPDAEPGKGAETVRLGERETAGSREVCHRFGQGMLRTRFGGSRQTQIGVLNVGPRNARLAFGHSAGLIQNDGIYAAQFFERFAALDQQAHRSPASGGDHHRCSEHPRRKLERQRCDCVRPGFHRSSG